MPSALDKRALFLQNLKDAGCSAELTEECVSYYDDGNYEKMLSELSAYRRTVLLETRAKQKQIDCLDFLANKIKKNEY
ncbi:MAG: hypothetical protein E7389_05080 [Ruminococcaceae bacterium]|nr:hypothetical protein [Oscillospiraceae bacterium]